VVQAFARHGRRYGTRQLRAEVHAEGRRVGRWRIRRVLRAQQPRSLADGKRLVKLIPSWFPNCK